MSGCQALIVLVALSLGHATSDGIDDVGFVQAKLQKHHRAEEKIGAGAPNRLNSVGYVGKGYDIYKGNPHEAGSIDPGFRRPVFALTYGDGKTTADGRWTIPDRTFSTPTKTCKHDFSEKDVSSGKAFSDSLSLDVKGSVNGAGAKFSAGGAYKDVEKESASEGNRFLEMKAQCSVYQIQIDVGMWPKLEEGFVARLAKLPAEFSENPGAFYSLIDDYGTHVTTTIEMGGRQGTREKFTKEQWKKTHERGWKVNAEGEYAPPAGAGVGGGGGGSFESNSEQNRDFSNSKGTKESFNQGGKYDKDPAKWAETLKDDPAPIKYEVKTLDEVIMTETLPADTELQIDQVVPALREALDNYCGHLIEERELETCDPPPDIPLFEREASLKWATMTMDKNPSHEDEMCKDDSWVDQVRLYEQGGHGVVGLEFHCVNDPEDDTRILLKDIAKNGEPKDWANCPEGFTQMQGKEQGSYGVVDAKVMCEGRFTALVNNEDGDWTNNILKCPDKQVIVGFQTAKYQEYGMTDFTITCSNAPAVQAAKAEYGLA